MILAIKYLVRLSTAEFQFESLLEVKEFLRHVNVAISGITTRIYKVTYTLNTSTHYVLKTETELTEW